MIKNRPSGSGTIADGSITEAKLDANLTTKVNAVGSVAEGSITSFHIATGSILGTDICGNTITYANIANNAITNTKIDNGAVTHAKLSSNCVESHNIVNYTILGTDISFGQISLEHLDASFNTTLTDFGVALEEDGDAIRELQKLQGVISIRNSTSVAQGFSYTLSYKDIFSVFTQFASYNNLDKTLTASHFFKLPSLTDNIYIEVSNAGGVSVEGADVLYGATLDEVEGNNILLMGTYGNNIMVEIEVAI
jgi:hypothetical protein